MGEADWLRDPLSFHGRVLTPPIESAVLAGNPLGDPVRREVPIYLPPGAGHAGERFPVVFLLSGFTGRGQSFLETHPWRRGVVARYDAEVAAGRCPPAILVLPDCFTRLGGSQYVNSSAVGRYADHVLDELVPFVDAQLPTLPGRRGIIGKSSGGFGAMHLTLQRPGVFVALGSIAGDCHFELCYAPQFLAAARGLLAHGSDPARFLAAFKEKPDLSGDGHSVIDLLAMSACYSPNPGSPLGFDLPIDLLTGERIPGVWRRWLTFDPLHAFELAPAAWSALELLHLEAGLRDEYHLQFGLRALVAKLTSHDIPHHHEEFEGGHFGTDDRYLALLPKVIESLLT